MRIRVPVALSLALSSGAHSAPLQLNDYLQQVKNSNQSVKASTLSAEAASEKSSDADMIYQPTAFATIQATKDKKELSPVSQRGSETDYTVYSGGVSKLTEWGTAAKVTYSTARTSIKDTEDRFVPEPSWYDASTTFEVSHPLWKNGLGSDVKNSVALQKQQTEITALTEGLKRKFLVSEAEGSYWRLVIARESLKTARDNLERSKRIVDWNQRRVRNELADSADLIQAESLYEVREIELTMALDEERAAAHSFNTSRGSSDLDVKEELVKITPELLASIPTPQKNGEREDVKAAVTAENLSEIGMNLAGTKYKPSVDVFANAVLNGRDTDQRTKAMSESVGSKYPTFTVGLKVSAPLGGDTESRMRGGWAKDKEAAALLASRKRFEGDREWSDLNRKLEESRSRLNLVQKVEATQKRKLDAERDRQNKGRSTMFQVMQYETDYAQSQLNVIRNKAEILGIIARMKTFGGEG